MPFIAHRDLAHRTRIACVVAASAAACLVVTAPAIAVTTIPLPAPLACPDLNLELDIGDDSKRNTRTFEDRDGNTVVLTTGAAESVVVTNVDTGESVTAPARGARTRTTTAADGTTTTTHTGHLLLVLFDTDLGGAGLPPSSTTLITGRTVYTVDKGGIFTVQRVNGKTTDIC